MIGATEMLVHPGTIGGITLPCGVRILDQLDSLFLNDPYKDARGVEDSSSQK
ncbi:hypothetical protein G3I19_00135 [Streptomyces sp. SID10853]|uniref:hypothetical protein n=1 Tax=Streptomyces sp. SID10853 TaxID=2706028 RepID=UPI0013BEFDBF|nr:hypothetical protein [Streptomyces sp. SID10853]NDZ76953.1 hypothetical protein [Streptomyces sp. SID10853]